MENKTEETQEKKKEAIVTKTLQELGLTLPIAQENAQDLTFSFKDWDMDVEEKLSELQERSKNVGEFVRQMMDLLLEDFCGKSWDSYSDSEKIMLMNNLHFPNMMYMYIALRVEELGHELHFDHINCPACNRAIKNYVADLRTLEVGCKHGDDGNLEMIYDLKKPIMLDDKIISQLKIKTTQWGALEKVPADKASNGATVKKAIFNSSIHGVLNNGEKVEGVFDIRTVVQKLKKYDIEKLQKEISINNAGPEMAIGGECPHCKSEFVKPLEWGYEVFFDSSSL